MLAWRDHLVGQLQQFNESAQSVMPSLATLNGPLTALQDYQAYPMVRRVSALFPQRPNPRQQPSQREGWWETLTGSSSPAPSSPPAYGDLYPEEREETEEDWSIKKASTLQAAADAAADQHFEQQPSHEGSQTSFLPNKVVVPNRRPIERVELSHDRKLFFFWVCLALSISSVCVLTVVQIPLLAIVLALMIRNSGISSIFVPSTSQTPPLSTPGTVGVF
jgi:hypothetical protein